MLRGKRPNFKHFATTALLVAGLAGFVFSTLLSGSAQAATGKIYFSPSSKTVENGSTVTMTVRIDPQTSVDTVHIVLTYDASKLQYSSMSYSGSPFANQVGLSISSGKIDFAQADLSGTPVSTDSFVSSVSFKALAGSGSTTVSLAGSDAGYGGPSTDPSISNGTVSFTTPSSGGGSNGGGSGGGSSSGGSNKPPKVTESNKLAVPVITVETAGYDKVYVTATTSIKADAYLKYGASKTSLTGKSAVSDNAITHQLSFGGLEPLTTYYYQVVATHGSTTKQTDVRAITTQGYTITVTVTDINDQPLANTLVTLHSTPISTKTDDKGVATFTSVPPGNHTISFTKGTTTYSKPVVVASKVTSSKSQQAALPQHFAVQFQYAQPAVWYQAVWFWTTIAAVAVVGSFLFLFRGKFQGLKTAEATGGMSITVGGGHGGPSETADITPPSPVVTPSAPQSDIDQVAGPPPGQPGSTIAPSEPSDDKTEPGSQ